MHAYIAQHSITLHYIALHTQTYIHTHTHTHTYTQTHTDRHIHADKNNTFPETKFLGQVKTLFVTFAKRKMGFMLAILHTSVFRYSFFFLGLNRDIFHADSIFTILHYNITLLGRS